MKTLTHLISQLSCACKEAKDFAHQSCVCECDTLVPMYQDLCEHEIEQAKIILEYMKRYLVDKCDDEDTRELFGEACEYAKEMLHNAEREIKEICG